jgi:FkbM family methyltransferase
MLNKSRKVFIDGGARTGESFEIIQRDLPEYGDFEVILFEPNPIHREHLTALSKEKSCKYVEGAIWDKTSTADFFIAVDIYGDQGSTLYSDKREELDRENPIQIKTYDIVDILSEFTEEDYVVLKLDVEGSEYDIIQRLIDTNNLGKVKEYLVEWHDHFYPSRDNSSSPLADEIRKVSNYRTWLY